jgi:HK97 family phage major capsid protein
MGPRAKLKALQKRAGELSAIGEKRDFTAAELAEVEKVSAELKSVRAEVERLDRNAAALKAIEEDTGDEDGSAPGFLNLKARPFVRALVDGMLADTGVGRKALVTGGSVAPLQIDQTPVPEGRPLTGLLQVIPAIQSAARFEYLRQVSRDLQAAPVAAGGTKPTSTLGLEKVPGELNVVAHVSEPIDHYMLEDAPALESFIGSELAYGVLRALEGQILNGTGTAPSLVGLLSATGVQAQAFATDLLTTARKAITLLEGDGLVPSAFVFAPADWEAVELSRTDSGTGKLEMVDQPVNRAERKLWGVPVVTSPEAVAGQAVLLSDGLGEQWNSRWR